MTDWVLFTGIAWMLLIASVVFVALLRISATMHDSASSPLHAHIRHLIHTEDRIGIALTAGAFIVTLVLAALLADQLLGGIIQKLAHLIPAR
jgi:hypothetical protein